ncbi:MAG: efflux RND transporter permease subunit [Gemmatimonadota bacterium]
MIRWSAGRPAVVWATSLSLLLAGALAFARLPLATRPVVELPRLSVNASWPGASAELVESYLTSPLEAAVQAVRGVKKVSSESGDGTSRITIELEPKADVQMARLGILERLELLREDLPAGASSPQVSNYVPEELDEQPLLRYTVFGPYTPATLAKLVDEQIKPRVSAVEGVAGVDSRSSSQMGVSVAYDDRRLRQLGISPALISDAIANSRLVQSMGKERSGSTDRPVVLRDQPAVIEDLGTLPVRGPAGRVFRISDLADIRLEEDSRDYFYRVNGVPAVGIDIARLPGADAIKTAARVRELMDGLKPMLAPGIRIQVESDESVELSKQLRDLLLRGGIAFGAVMIVLILSLRNAKSVLLVMGSAAIAIAGTALGLFLLGIPANLLTLAGLGMGIGILVQNGVVVVERLRLAPDTVEGRAGAGRKIFPAVLGSTVTTAVVLLPFLYLQGNARAAFVPFAVAFILALAWSIVSAVVMIPALAAGHGIRSGHWPRLSRAYTRVVMASLRWRPLTLALAVAILAVTTWGFVKKVPKSSFGNWYGQRTTLNVYMSFPRGSDPSSLDRAMGDFERLVVGEEGVEQVVTTGSPDGASMSVLFSREAQYGPQPYVLEELLTQRAILVGGASISVHGNGPGFYSGGGGSSSTFQIKVLGYSFSGVEQLALDLKSRLERIPRVKEVDANAASFWQREKSFSVVLDPDRAALARYGLTARDLAAAVSREVRGPVGRTELEIGGEKIPVNVKVAGARDRTLEQLREALLPNSTGAPARITDVAAVSEREALTTINREDQQYVRLVSYQFRGPQKLANRTHEAFMKSISVPPGYSVADNEFGWEPDESGKGLWLVFSIGIVLVLLAVMMVFNSAWAAGIVFCSLPLALAGSAAAFWIGKAAFSREAAVGVILVVGLAVNHVILLVDAALQRRATGPLRQAVGGQGGPAEVTAGSDPAHRLPLTAHHARSGSSRRGLSGYDVLFACRDRAGIIVLTTLTTLASLIPLAVGTKSDELFGSIALATVGGVIAGTIGALFFVPAMILGRHGVRRARRPRKWKWFGGCKRKAAIGIG